MTQPDNNTRDIAVAAETKIDAHVLDCVAVRGRIEKTLDNIQADLKRINWYLPMILGGIVLASHSIDWILTFMGHGK